MVQWKNVSFPSWGRGFDSRYRLHKQSEVRYEPENMGAGSGQPIPAAAVPGLPESSGGIPADPGGTATIYRVKCGGCGQVTPWWGCKHDAQLDWNRRYGA